MPKLPSVQERPVPQPSTRIVPVEAGDVGRSVSRLGGAIANVGDAMFQIDEQITKSRRVGQLTEMLGGATNDISLLELQYQRDSDFKTSPKRFQEDVKGIFDKYETQIDDDIVKQSFRSEFGKLAQVKSLNVLKDSVRKEQDFRVANLDDSLDIYARSAAQAKSQIEREAVVNHARLSIAGMVTGRWISAEDGAKRERQFSGRIDQYTVLEDMRADPTATGDRLMLDSEYAPHIDPLQRERLVDTAYRRAESDRATQEKVRKQLGDQLLSEAWSRSDKGTLDRSFVEHVRPYVSPTEYRMLLKTFRAGPEEDDPRAFTDLMDKLGSDPQEAERLAFHYREANQISNTTMKSVLTSARSKGPKPPYEREKERVMLMLRPPPMATDPAPYARQGLALQEYDDYVVSGKRTDEDLRKKADEVVKKYSLINMADLARKTAPGAKEDDPASVIDALAAQARKLGEDKQANRISEDEYRKKLAELNAARRMAEKASGQ